MSDRPKPPELVYRAPSERLDLRLVRGVGRHGQRSTAA